MVFIPPALSNIGPRIWKQVIQTSEGWATKNAAHAAQDFFTPVADTLGQQVRQALSTHNLGQHLDGATPIFQSTVSQTSGIFNINDTAAMMSRMISNLLKNGHAAEIRVLNFPDAASAKAFMDSRATKRFKVTGQSVEKLTGSRNGVFASVSHAPINDTQLIQIHEMGTGPKFKTFKTTLGRGAKAIQQAVSDIIKAFYDAFGTLLGGLKQTITNTAKTARGQNP